MMIYNTKFKNYFFIYQNTQSIRFFDFKREESTFEKM